MVPERRDERGPLLVNLVATAVTVAVLMLATFGYAMRTRVHAIMDTVWALGFVTIALVSSALPAGSGVAGRRVLVRRWRADPSHAGQVLDRGLSGLRRLRKPDQRVRPMAAAQRAAAQRPTAQRAAGGQFMTAHG